MSHREWCRVTVFVRGKGKKAKGYAYDLLNKSRRHERLRGSPAATRVAGTGSFYWPSAREAWRAAQVELRKPEVDSVRVETISGRKIGYASKHGSYAYTADDRDARRERVYHVVAINERTGKKTYQTSTPMTHHEATNMLRAFHPRPKQARHVRIQLEEASRDRRRARRRR